MKFPVKDSLTEEELKSGLKNVIMDGLTTHAMATLTGGVFLVAFALKLGASNLTIGILAAIPPLGQLIQIPAIYIVEKYRNRRDICIVSTAASRSFWLLIALIPFLYFIKIPLALLIIALALNSAFSSIGGCSWNSWMRDLVPVNQMGSFFGKRMVYASIVGILFSIVAGIFIDYWKQLYPDRELYAYSYIFIAGFLAGMFGLYFLSKTPEPRMVVLKEKVNFYRLLLQPFKDPNFKNLIFFLSSWNFAVNLAAPFFTVYMLKRLNLDMSTIIILMVLNQVVSIAFLNLWGKYSDRFSNKSILSINGPLFIVCILAWTFTARPEKYILTMPLLVIIHALMGISSAGITLSSGNIGLKLAPKGQATSYLAASSFVNSLAAGIAPVLGGLFADFFEKTHIETIINWGSPIGTGGFYALYFRSLDFFFLFAFLIGFYSIHRLALVKEVGEVEEKIVVNELISEVRRDMRTFSTASGLRSMVQFPYSILIDTIENVRVLTNFKSSLSNLNRRRVIKTTMFKSAFKKRLKSTSRGETPEKINKTL
ncbi:MAG TPA: MFS transporter [Candidatus Methylomirabilis sp.]|nr:MFS transporter [Candidatus Methylomirabilis sp.]